MISKAYIFETDSLDPYHNLALEEYLLDTLPYDSVLLYLWQNERTVVIGRNQSSENEVNTEKLESDGGHLARRLSGGGAVYHDRGNLNFTFIIGKQDFDIEKQDQVVVRALNDLGIKAEVNGRNDLTVNGSKFSGHAYYHSDRNSFHHGTIMVSVDADDLSRYLNVSKKKLAGRNVESVRSRVINLAQIDPDITVGKLKEALKHSFLEIYGADPVLLNENEFDRDRIQELENRFSSSAWKYDKKEIYDFSREYRFAWGLVNIRYSLYAGLISRCCIYTDSLSTDKLERLPLKLKGKEISPDLYYLAENEEENDVIDLLMRKE